MKIPALEDESFVHCPRDCSDQKISEFKIFNVDIFTNKDDANWFKNGMSDLNNLFPAFGGFGGIKMLFASREIIFLYTTFPWLFGAYQTLSSFVSATSTIALS